MRDVLLNLQKLPEKCAMVMEGRAFFIHRGARDAGPAFIAIDQVDQWNANAGVNPQQVQAMLVGVTLGWDMDGADPDTHAADLGSEPGPFDYEFVATISVNIQIQAHTQEHADMLARSKAENIADRITFDIGDVCVASVETLDMLNTDNPD